MSNATGLSTTDEPSSSGDESRTVDIMRGDTSVRKISTNGTLSRTESPPSVSSLKIRPPTQLMGDTSPQQIMQDLPSTQWKHQPDVLVKGSCNYTAKVSLSISFKNILSTYITSQFDSLIFSILLRASLKVVLTKMKG